MKILFLSFYFPPDLCAGSFRAGPLAEALRVEGGDELSLDILTTSPNRYRSFQVEAKPYERLERTTVRRIALPSHASGMIDQSRAFANYTQGVLEHVRGKSWDLVLATSSRLMTAVLAGYVARQLRARLYLDIRDLFTDTMGDVLRGPASRLLLPLFRTAERYTFRSATRINVVSGGFVEDVQSIAPSARISVHTNGIDQLFLERRFSSTTSPETTPLVLYAGNLGDGQGLHRVIPEAARLAGDRYRFRIIGDGGRRSELERAIGEVGVSNVEVWDPVPREGLCDQYAEADVLLLHLNDFNAFRKVLPSKVFEYGATGKPLVAGVAGYAARFLRKELPDAEVFPPCDAQALIGALQSLPSPRMTRDRGAFKNRYARKQIMHTMAREILETAEGSGIA